MNTENGTKFPPIKIEDDLVGTTLKMFEDAVPKINEKIKGGIKLFGTKGEYSGTQFGDEDFFYQTKKAC